MIDLKRTVKKKKIKPFSYLYRFIDFVSYIKTSVVLNYVPRTPIKNKKTILIFFFFF